MSMVIESLQELHRITERRDGAVFKTEYVDDVWYAKGDELGPDDLIVPLSTERSRKLELVGETTIRRRA